MREILLYGVAALSSIVVLGYSVHMFIGGLVSHETEVFAISAACTVGAAVIGVMWWDVARRRPRK